MSSATYTLLNSIKTELETNSTFPYLTAVYVVQALQEEYIPEIGTQPPFALVYPMTGATFEPQSMSNVCNAAIYTIGISIFQEYWGANIGMLGDGDNCPSTNIKGVTEIAQDLKSVFDRNTFSDVVLSAVQRTENYSPVGFVQWNNQSLAQVHVQLEYLDEDRG